MKMLELAVAGVIPEGVAAESLQSVVATINELQPEWLQQGTIGLKLVDDAEIQELNEKYAGENHSTDVLSFSYLEDGAMQEGELGDMVISLETAERQAAQAETSLADELGTLAAHGILHIFGFDHADTAERLQMEDLQKEIVEKSGLKYRDFKWVT